MKMLLFLSLIAVIFSVVAFSAYKETTKPYVYFMIFQWQVDNSLRMSSITHVRPNTAITKADIREAMKVAGAPDGAMLVNCFLLGRMTYDEFIKDVNDE